MSKPLKLNKELLEAKKVRQDKRKREIQNGHECMVETPGDTEPAVNTSKPEKPRGKNKAKKR
ncbi:MAG: hypothetical protein MPK62_02540 [Alphaproteobacteria bacterium]|nr:hypothetical protein [Alphaproteobacteria bacterium]